MFLNICEATKHFLRATLPKACPIHPNSAEPGSISSVTHPLYQQVKGSVVSSEGNTANSQGNQGGVAQNSLVTTLTTISSIMTSTAPTKVLITGNEDPLLLLSGVEGRSETEERAS